MGVASIITAVIYLMVAAMMLGIGISQLRSTSPAGFYSGVKPPEKDELTDVEAWNKKHGIMWIVYGVIILISWFVGYLIGDSILCLIPLCGGVFIPVLIMMWYHHRLEKRYIK